MKTLNDRIEVLECKVFRAIDNPILAGEFMLEHYKMLNKNGIKNLKSAEPGWIQNPGVYVIVVLSGKKIVGGTRVHVNISGYRYSFFDVLGEINPELEKSLDSKRTLHGEASGLWVSSSHSKLGIGQFLSQFMVMTAHVLGLDQLFGLCGEHTLDLLRTSGFHFLTYKDERVEFKYPTPNFQTYAIQCEVSELKFTFSHERASINSWIEDPYQRVLANGPLGDCVIQLTGLAQMHEDLEEILSRPAKPYVLKPKGKADRA